MDFCQLFGQRNILFTGATRPLAPVNVDQRLQVRRLADPEIFGHFPDMSFKFSGGAN
jgi:hypothetical protein